MRSNQHFVTLHPADDEKMKAFCGKTTQKQASVIREIVHQVINGTLVRKESKRSFFDLT